MPIVVEVFEPSHYVLYDLESTNSELSDEDRSIYDSIENSYGLPPYTFFMFDYLSDEEIEILMSSLDDPHGGDELIKNFFELDYIDIIVEALTDTECDSLEALYT